MKFNKPLEVTSTVLATVIFTEIFKGVIKMTESSTLWQALISSLPESVFVGGLLSAFYLALKWKIEKQSYYVNAIAFVLDYRTKKLAESTGSFFDMPQSTVGQDTAEEKQLLKNMLEVKYGDKLTVNEIKQVIQICYAENIIS